MFRSKNNASAFTLIELLMVIAIIVVLVSVSMPLLSKLAQSNKRSQAVNLATAYIANARSLAIQMRRHTCVVFYEQSPTYALPSNPNQTALAIGIADTGISPDPANGNIIFKALSDRQPDYMPYGIRVAAVGDYNSGSSFTIAVRIAANTTNNSTTRAIVFDPSGQMIIRSGLAASPTGNPGNASKVSGDWNFYVNGVSVSPVNHCSTPAILVYDYREYTDGTANIPSPAVNDPQRAAWILANADIIAVNAYTGNVLR